MTRLGHRLTDSALLLLRTGTDSNRSQVERRCCVRKGRANWTFGVAWSETVKEQTAVSASEGNGPFRFERHGESVAWAFAALSRHDLDLLLVQDDAVEQRISGAEGPIGLTIFASI